MNPEEGDLRPQLLDRFALSVEIYGIRDARDRVAIMERNLAFEADPTQFAEAWQPKEQELSQQIARARKLVEQVGYSSRDLLSIAALTSSLGVDGHRPDLVILKAARAQAAFEGRLRISQRDIALAAELALPHRLKHTPFQQSAMGMEELSERIEQLQGQSASEGQPQEEGEEATEERVSQKKK
jgi:Mg-chelatase subunit ChlI